MRVEVIVLVALLAYASASPLSLERSKDDSIPMKVVDVPAGMFENTEEEKPIRNLNEEESVKVETPVEIKPIVEDKPEKATEIEKPVNEGTEVVNEEGPNVFGFKFPSIIIFRRPAVVRDPFASLFPSSPFFADRPISSIFSNRPTSSIFSNRPSSSIFSSSEEKDLENPAAEQVGEDQKTNASENNSTIKIRVDDVVKRMQEQINNLWTNLFNLPRPTFTRPSFLAPFPASDPSENDKESIDFGNLPANYSNSTSETKLVDGQLVTVNKTIHRVSNNNSNGFFQFSIIKIRPTEVKAQPEEATASDPKPVVIGASNPEIAEEAEKIPVVTTIKNAEIDPQLNEVDRADDEDKETKLSEAELKNKYEIESLEPLSSDSQQHQMTDEDIKIVPIMSAKLIKAPGKNVKYGTTDLSGDIRVNNLMEKAAQSGRLRALYDPEEVEVFA